MSLTAATTFDAAKAGFIAIRIAVGLLGGYIIAATFVSAMKTVVVPRAGSLRITRFVFIIVRKVIDFLAPPDSSMDRRDRFYSFYGPFSFVLLPVAWLVSSGFGFGCIYWALAPSGKEGGLRNAFSQSGSSMLTLGVFSRRDLPFVSFMFLQATLGLILVAMLISYLPTIYGAYSRRETLVAMFESRAGLPPSPHEVLQRFAWIGALDTLDDDVFLPWEQWFAEVEESTLSFAGLAFYRSPHPERSWITAAGAVLDLASIRMAVLDMPPSPRAALCMRQGFLALRRIANYFLLPNPDDPNVTDTPITVTRREFDLAMVELRAVGLPVKEDLDQAWLDFVGWRVNYDESLVRIAKMVHAPPGIWSSDREFERLMPKLVRRRRRT